MCTNKYNSLLVSHNYASYPGHVLFLLPCGLGTRVVPALVNPSDELVCLNNGGKNSVIIAMATEY